MTVLRTRMNSRADHGQARARSSTRSRGTKFVPSTKFVPKIDEREAAQQFSAVVTDFSAGQLASASDRSKETAKNWKAGRAFPNGASIINLARANPTIRAWLMHEIGETAEFDDPRVLARAMVLLTQARKEV